MNYVIEILRIVIWPVIIYSCIAEITNMVLVLGQRYYQYLEESKGEHKCP